MIFDDANIEQLLSSGGLGDVILPKWRDSVSAVWDDKDLLVVPARVIHAVLHRPVLAGGLRRGPGPWWGLQQPDHAGGRRGFLQ
jgi:hypothetical protein